VKRLIMHYLIISDSKSSHHKFYPIKKDVTSIGNGPDYDIAVNSEKSLSFMILQDNGEVSFVPMNEKLKNFSGPWKKPLKQNSFLEVDQLIFIFLYNFNQNSLPTPHILDWNFNELPKNFRQKDYPEKLLNFILQNLNLEQGIFLLKSADSLKEICRKNLKLNDCALFYLNEMLLDPKDSVILVDPLKHSSIFKSDQADEKSYYLVRTQLEDEQELILYIPQKQGQILPHGMLKTLLYFVSQSIYAHLTHLYNERLKLSQMKNELKTYPIGQKMQYLEELAKKLSPTDLSLLILGETGVGKEVLAKKIAKNSGNKKIVSVNCAAIPKELAESILFGHKKGSFTHAITDQQGKIQEANRGILFLDEVGELPLELQAKLLRILQEKTVTPIGGKEENVQFRLVCATHQNLKEMIQQGKFREDFYYRINEASLTIPPLRERREEIPYLAMEFLQQVLIQNDVPPKIFGKSCESFFQTYNFPGNIRELKSLVRKLAILVDGKTIERKDFEELTHQDKKENLSLSKNLPLDLKTAKKIFYENQIHRALMASNGHKNIAANLLGISQRTFFRLMAENQIKLNLTANEYHWQ